MAAGRDRVHPTLEKMSFWNRFWLRKAMSTRRKRSHVVVVPRRWRSCDLRAG
jgi:hypothetical protein